MADVGSSRLDVTDVNSIFNFDGICDDELSHDAGTAVQSNIHASPVENPVFVFSPWSLVSEPSGSEHWTPVSSSRSFSPFDASSHTASPVAPTIQTLAPEQYPFHPATWPSDSAGTLQTLSPTLISPSAESQGHTTTKDVLPGRFPTSTPAKPSLVVVKVPDSGTERRTSGTSTLLSSIGEDEGTCCDNGSPVQSLRGAVTDESAVESDGALSRRETPSPSTLRVPSPLIRPTTEHVQGISRTARSNAHSRSSAPMGHWVSPTSSYTTHVLSRAPTPAFQAQPSVSTRARRSTSQAMPEPRNSAPMYQPLEPIQLGSHEQAGPSRPQKRKAHVSDEDEGAESNWDQERAVKRPRGAPSLRNRWDPKTASLNDWITSAIETGTGLRGRKKILEKTECRLCDDKTLQTSQGRHLKTHHRGALGQQFSAAAAPLTPSDMIILFHFTLSFVQNNPPTNQGRDAALERDIANFLRDWPDVPTNDEISFDGSATYPALYQQVVRLSRGWNLVCEWCDTVCSRSDAMNRHLRTVCDSIPPDVKAKLLEAYKGKNPTRGRKNEKKKAKANTSTEEEEDDDDYEDD